MLALHIAALLNVTVLVESPLSRVVVLGRVTVAPAGAASELVDHGAR